VVLFAFQSDEVRRRWLTILDTGDVRYNGKRFLARAAQIRKQGYASIQSEAVAAVLDLSAPITAQDSSGGRNCPCLRGASAAQGYEVAGAAEIAGCGGGISGKMAA